MEHVQQVFGLSFTKQGRKAAGHVTNCGGTRPEMRNVRRAAAPNGDARASAVRNDDAHVN